MNETRATVRSTAMTIAFFACYVLGAWSIYFLWVHFQLVQAQGFDYIALGILALGVPLWFALRKVGREQRSIWSILGTWSAARAYVGAAILMALVGGGLLEAANGFLDSHSPVVYATIVSSRCYRGRLAVQGAPTVPTIHNSIDLEVFPFGGISCYGLRIGDTLFISVKQGHFGRPWVSGLRLQPIPDSAQIQQIHERHRALVGAHLKVR